MSNIEELQRRITAALDQVAAGVATLSAAPSMPDADSARALEDERTANAQLQERVRTLRVQADSETAALRAELDGVDARMAKLDVELQRVRRSNQELRAACAALQSANAEGVGDASAINNAMKSELEALRATRAADVAEADVILASLQTLMKSPDTTSAKGDA